MGRRVGWALTALAALALAGCSAGGGSTSSADSAGVPEQAAVAPEGGLLNGKAGTRQGQSQQGQSEPGQSEPGKSQPDQPRQGQPAVDDRQLVRTAAVDLRAEDVEGALTRVKDVVLGAGGFTSQENAQLKRASVTLEVPGDQLDAVLGSITALDGVEVTRREVRTEDVTEQVVDIEARLANQRASVERVRALLDRASSTSEITGIEAELTKRQSELESLQRRYDALKGQVALSTLTVSITSRDAPVAAPEDPGFLDALGGGWRALVTAVGWLLVVLGAALPFAVVLGVPAFGYLWWRRRRKGAITPQGDAG
ncbi:DUF4349 domain-containing protein [Saccharothrix longispora]|uniref:DUF4349 domain-containing protein n=1 Tax=Saccharothrix longispora TaxID=33920 RepID=UPI0028FDB43E|nr:DUF4349 domain-containing protein [Saccharothrix longispora]MDU0291417.1 DUF4349 domain-containing protein [Saccharothrix longispora]